MNIGLAGKVAIVTGGSRGLGKAIGFALADCGATVALVSRGADALHEAAMEIRESTGETVIALPGDTTDDSSVERVVHAAASELGGIDILINAAAAPAFAGAAPVLADLSQDVLWPELNVKVIGYVRMMRECVPFMRLRGGGRIVNVAGLGVRETGSILSSLRNAAVTAISKNLADELSAYNIAVLTVNPAFTITERTPEVLEAMAERLGVTTEEAERRIAQQSLVGRVLAAPEVADAVAFLASPKAVAISGESVAVGGGRRGSIYY